MILFVFFGFSDLQTSDPPSETSFVVTDQQLQFFQKYVGHHITKSEILQRASAAREKALKVLDYRFLHQHDKKRNYFCFYSIICVLNMTFNDRCIREWRFLDSRLFSHPLYQSRIRPSLQNKKILDLGCCFGNFSTFGHIHKITVHFIDLFLQVLIFDC